MRSKTSKRTGLLVGGARLVVRPLKAGEPVVFFWDPGTKFWRKAVP